MKSGSSTVHTIGRLKKSQNTLEQREKHLETQIRRCLVQAKEKMRKKDKRGAMFQLKRKKMLQKNLDNLQGMRLNIEQQIMTLESAATTSVVVDSLSTARDEMKNLNKKVNVDNLEDLRDDLDEATADQEDITNILSDPMTGDLEDDDELLAELDGMEDEEMKDENREAQRRVLGLPTAPDETPIIIPSAPTDEPVTDVKVSDADELAELEALMA